MRTRGYTLLEVLVAMVLGLLVLALGLALYQFSVKEWSRLSTRIELQQMAATVLNRLAADARDSTPGGVSELPEGTALGLVRLEDVGSDGVQIWEERLIVYSWSASERKLWRRNRPNEDPKGKGPKLKLKKNHPGKLPPPLMKLVAGERSDTDQLVASDVILFQADLAGDPETPAQPLTVRIGLEKAILHARPERFELERDVFLRNSP